MHKHCFQFLLGLTVAPREISSEKVWRDNKGYYGIFEKGLYIFFFAEFALKSVQFPAKRNAYVPVNQHGRRDVICRPAVPKKSKTIDIITLFNLVTLMPRFTGFYNIKHFHSSLCTFFLRQGVVVFVIIAPRNLYHAE